MPQSAFASFPPQRVFVFPVQMGATWQVDDSLSPCTVRAHAGSSETLAADATHFVIVHRGRVEVRSEDVGCELGAGQFGSFPGATSLRGDGVALVVSQYRYDGLPLCGGPIEESGRLRYIDGCTSTQLLQPPVRGEPCLNLLCLPGHTRQTMHSHPSLRVGLIVSGSGSCDTAHGMLNFDDGTCFFIPPGADHSFCSGEQPMRIVIFHPDSDSGPTHGDHTMLNRTVVQGSSARYMPQLHTTAEART